MADDFEAKLDQLADVMVEVGLNLQPGQRLIIGTLPTLYGVAFELAPLVRAIATKAYQRGARNVEVLWRDDDLRLIRFAHAPRDSFETYPAWRYEAMLDHARNGDAIIDLHAVDPDLLVGQDAALVGMEAQIHARQIAPTRAVNTRAGTNWLIATGAIEPWARKVFPDLDGAAARERLWEVLFDLYRLREADPISAWREHLKQLAARRDYLTAKRYTALRLTAPGTDLTVGLPDGHLWTSVNFTRPNGQTFVANLPTEEVFTLPHRERVEGTVRSTKPLSYGGSLIDDFTLTFAAGRVVRAEAATGDAALQSLLATDEGAQRLGEVALVPHSSPISQSGVLFYNTLLDENASNHVALGGAYPLSLVGGETMADADFIAAGGNKSNTHVDFMIGSDAMDVDGVTAAGDMEAVMRGGEWAFGV